MNQRNVDSMNSRNGGGGGGEKKLELKESIGS